MKFKEIRCENCICKIKDARDVIEADIIAGCSYPRYREFFILGKHDRIVSIHSGLGCCHDKLFVVYKPVRGGSNVKNIYRLGMNDKRGETTPPSDNTTIPTSSPVNESFTTSWKQGKMFLETREYNSTIKTLLHTGNSQSVRFKLSSQAFWTGCIAFGAIFLLVFLSILTLFLVRRRKDSRMNSEGHDVPQNPSDTEYSTIAEVLVRREDAPDNTSLEVSSPTEQDPEENTYYILEKDVTSDKEIQCNLDDFPQYLPQQFPHELDTKVLTQQNMTARINNSSFMRQQSEPAGAVCSVCLKTFSDTERAVLIHRSLSVPIQGEMVTDTSTVHVQNFGWTISFQENPYDMASASDDVYAHLKRNTGLPSIND